MGLTGVGKRVRVIKETPAQPITIPTPVAEPEPIVAEKAAPVAVKA